MALQIFMCGILFHEGYPTLEIFEVCVLRQLIHKELLLESQLKTSHLILPAFVCNTIFYKSRQIIIDFGCLTATYICQSPTKGFSYSCTNGRSGSLYSALLSTHFRSCAVGHITLGSPCVQPSHLNYTYQNGYVASYRRRCLR